LPVEMALAKTREALHEEGFLIITEINLQQQFEGKLHQAIRRYWILGVWVPALELKAVASEPEIGLLMPSHICIWENDDGTASLATAALKHLTELTEHPTLAEAARAVNARLSAVMDWVRTTTMTAA
jgi:uncharacterized protein (DUF302 family)